MTLDEWQECDEMLRSHPLLAGALARRGISDMSLVLTDVWAYGAALVPQRYRGLRLGWSDVWHRASDDGNPYAHHVTGLHPGVDLKRMAPLELEGRLDARERQQGEAVGQAPPALGPVPRLLRPHPPA